MTILLTGGGTGGHITPILAVAHELKKLQPDCHIVYVGERHGKYTSMTKDNQDIDRTVSIYAGKFRRYHGESWIHRILDIKTNLLNIRDAFYVGVGSIQSLVMIRKVNPDVVFLKGGFVGVPVGLASAFWRKKIITHDSDAIPGLANRLVSRWVTLHATAMPPEQYQYPKVKTSQVGVLVTKNYRHVTKELKLEYRNKLKIPLDAEYLMITGGSGGAHVINVSIAEIAPELLKIRPKLHIIHTTGIGKSGIYGEYAHSRLHIVELLSDMYLHSGAADVIITRAGANTIAEFGTQGKACIVIPNPLLTGGHQLKNSDYLHNNKASVVLEEKAVIQDPQVLKREILKLLDDSDKREGLARNLQAITVPDAAKNLASVLLGDDKHESS